MTKILEFPKDKSKLVRARRKLEGQRLVLGLSLFSFIFITVMANEQVMKLQRPIYLISDNSPTSLEQVNRAIASAQPLNLFRDVEWEHQLAKRLSVDDDRRPASVAKKVTLLDHLRYGTLAGKYHIQSSTSDPANFKIREIQYVDSTEISDRPVIISDHAAFLQEYRPLLPVDFKRTALVANVEGVETWSLISDQGDVVGRAHMRFNDDGHFLGFKVDSLARMSAE